jgi:hypothetical protein
VGVQNSGPLKSIAALIIIAISATAAPLEIRKNIKPLERPPQKKAGISNHGAPLHNIVKGRPGASRHFHNLRIVFGLIEVFALSPP